MDNTAIKVAFVFQKQYTSYVEVFLNYSDKLITPYLFSLDEDMPVIENRNVVSITEITSYMTEVFDYVVTMSDFDDQVKDLIMQTFTECPPRVYPYDEVGFLLNSYGRMLLLKTRIDLEIPRRPNRFMELGDFTYIVDSHIMNTSNDGSVTCRVGKFCLLGAEHPISWVSTYPLASFVPGYEGEKESANSKGDVIIGNDVWIGNGATILSGVTIGDGSVIGAKAVVTKSVEPYSIVVGNPGRVIRKRFGDDMIRDLLEMKWWDWSYEHIYEIIPYLQSENFEEVKKYWLEYVR